MPLFTHESRDDAGLSLHLGANPRPFDPRELPYSLTAALPPSAVDLSQPRSLARFGGRDLRPEIEDQGPIGACTSYSCIACARINAALAGRPSTAMLTGDRLYELARQKEGSFPRDAGSTLADNLDILRIAGDTFETEDAEHHDAAFDYADSGKDTTGQAWVGAHHPFYAAAGSMLENIWTALDQGLPVEFGFYWPAAWFTPDALGVVDPVQLQAAAVGGHAFYGWQMWPDSRFAGGGVVCCANQWTNGWNRQAPGSGVPDVRPGDFLIPFSVFTSGQASLCFEARAVSPNPYVKPNPQPQPSPTDPYCTWLGQEAAYMLHIPEAPRAGQAQVVLDTTRRFFPGVS